MNQDEVANILESVAERGPAVLIDAKAYPRRAYRGEELIAVFEHQSDAQRFAASEELLEVLRIIIANATVIADPRMEGATDCYAVPLDDIEAARSAITKAGGAS